jgi:hypothetical protein
MNKKGVCVSKIHNMFFPTIWYYILVYIIIKYIMELIENWIQTSWYNSHDKNKNCKCKCNKKGI